MLQRKHITDLTYAGAYNANSEKANPETPTDAQEGALVTSLVIGDSGLHAPVIDIDIQAQLWPAVELLPSSQLGHSHLYFNHEMSTDNYFKLLEAMVGAGLVEPGYYDAAKANGYTAVRTVGTIKPGVNMSVARVLEENARLKRQVMELTRKLKLEKPAMQIEIVPIDHQPF